MLSSPSETKYPTGGESQNLNWLNTCLYFLFLLPVPSALIYYTEVYKSSYKVICRYPFSLSTDLTSDLKLLLISWKSLFFAVGKKKKEYWGSGYRIFIPFWGCIFGTDVNGQSARSCHLGHGTWALFGINSFKSKIILAAKQIDSCCKKNFLKWLFSLQNNTIVVG